MKIFFLGVIFLFFLCNATGASELHILTENLPPLNFVRDGKLIGPSVEIVQEILKRINSNEEIQVFPWARAYKMVLEQENIVLFGMTYTEDRRDKFHWVGPLATKRDILVGKKGTGIKIDTLNDAKKVNRIGTLRDDTREQFLKKNGFKNLESVSDEQLNAKKLSLGRIDLWAYKQPGLKTVCDLAGVNYDDLEEVYHLRKIDVSIAFSKKTSEVIVKKWRDAFNDMIADGTVSEIWSKWNVE